MASAKTWFVQTGFGTVLGPMPEDVLQEMVRTGALVRSDQVREGTDGEWRPASETPGLFNAVSEPAFPEQPAVESESPLPELPAAEAASAFSLEIRRAGDVGPSVASSQSASKSSDTLQPAATSSSLLGKGRLIPPPAPMTSAPSESSLTPPVLAVPPVYSAETPPPTSVWNAVPDSASLGDKLAVESPSDAASAIRPAPPEDDLIARWREERDRTREELGAVSLAAEMNQSSREEDFAPELPAGLLDDEEVDSTLPESPTVSVLTDDKPRRSAVERPAFLDQVARLEAGPRVPVETIQQKWGRWRRSLPSWQIATAVLVMALSAWWFWPRSSRGIHKRYLAIWDEWKVRRVDPKDQAGWEQFLQRTECELNATVPYLEKHANSADREQQLLLFVGRDCFQKMLKQPRQIGSPREKQLEVLFESLHKLYESGSGTAFEPVIGSGRSRRRPADSKPPAESVKDSGATQPSQREPMSSTLSPRSLSPSDKPPER